MTCILIFSHMIPYLKHLSLTQTFPVLCDAYTHQNLSSSQQIFPILWKQAVVVPVFKEGKAAVENSQHLF